MEFTKMYQLFKNDDGVIWKIEEKYMPSEKIEHWSATEMMVTKEQLEVMNIKL